MAFYGSNDQEGPTTFDTSTQYTIWDSGCTHSINPLFELYTHYKPLEKGDNKEFSGIGGLVKHKCIGTVVLYLEDGTGKLHNLIFDQLY